MESYSATEVCRHCSDNGTTSEFSSTTLIANFDLYINKGSAALHSLVSNLFSVLLGN